MLWSQSLRSFADRGPRGVKLVVADVPRGLRAAARQYSTPRTSAAALIDSGTPSRAPAKQRNAAVAMPKAIFAQETGVDAEVRYGVLANTLREMPPNSAAASRSIA